MIQCGLVHNYIIEKNIGKGIYMLSSISNPKLKVKRASACHLKPFKTRPKASSNESHYSRPLSVSFSFDNQSACMESDSMSSKNSFWQLPSDNILTLHSPSHSLLVVEISDNTIPQESSLNLIDENHSITVLSDNVSCAPEICQVRGYLVT